MRFTFGHGALVVAAVLSLTTHALATINVISDQIVDGSGNPFQRPGGGNVTLADLGLDTVPFGAAPPVRVVPWASIPGDISQMQHYGENKLYFATINQGQIWEYDLNGVRNSTPLLNVDAARSAFSTGGPTSGQGLRGFAFHPEFATNHLLYTMHREDTSGGTATHGGTMGGGNAIAHYVLAEWNLTNPASPGFRSLMRIAYPATDHVGSQVNFNPVAMPGHPDYGNLYVAFGDGGGGCSGSNSCHDMFGYGTNMSAIQASMIRVNPLQSGPNPYTIPADNPWLAANDPAATIPDEMYAKGFRNPTTMLFDQQTGALFSGDISQNTIEEINLIQAGHNYGWGQVEGTWLHVDRTNTSATMRYIPLGDGSDVTATSATYVGADRFGNPVTFTNINRLNDGYTSPIAMFSHERNQLDAANQSAAITGTVYRGVSAPALEGLFLYSSLSQDEIYYLHEADLVNDESPAQTQELRILDQNGNPTRLWQIVGAPASTHRVNHRFGQDANGDIYIISKHNDMIYRLEAAVAPSIFGDTDLDGDVDQVDLDNFLAGWMQSAPVGPQSWMLGDFNLNGITDLPDVYYMHQGLMAAGLGSLSPFGGLLPSVPEPAAGLLMLCGIVALLGSPRRVAGARQRGLTVFVSSDQNMPMPLG